ncbi:MAG: hypothetical protein RTU92_03805 [Candidatus Thorarchaeota archaeon]
MDATTNRESTDFRNISDVRIQYQCSYRLYLKQKVGDTPSIARERGSQLHQEVFSLGERDKTVNTKLILAVIIITLVDALIWMFGRG